MIKSDLLTYGLRPISANNYAKVFCCKLSDFPIKYLGVPLHFTKLRRVDLQPVIDKIIKRIAGWRGRLLSYAGRLIPAIKSMPCKYSYIPSIHDKIP